MGKIESHLLKRLNSQSALFAVLLDPDSENFNDIVQTGIDAALGGADLLLMGGSFIANPSFTKVALDIKKESDIPIVLFPGGASQVIPGPDAILFTVLVSGRNPQYLIDEQVRGAMLVKQLGIEPIPTAYILIESGKTTAVEYISNTRPIPADKPGITAAHALAAQMMGQRWVYLEAGSGAKNPVPLEIIGAVRKITEMNIIAGGGIRNPADAAARVKAGAHMIVIGTHFEKNKDSRQFKDFAKAIHQA